MISQMIRLCSDYLVIGRQTVHARYTGLEHSATSIDMRGLRGFLAVLITSGD